MHPPRGMPLVIVPGLGGAAAGWDAVAAALAERRPVWRYELPGHGARPALPGQTSLDALVEELAGLLDGPRAGPVAVAGHSLGGVVALGFALAHPQRCGALVLIATTPEAAPPEEHAALLRLSDGLRDAGDGGRAAVARAFVERPDQTGRLESLTVPALIVVGEQDGWRAQRGAELLHGWMPNSRLVRLAGAGHHPHREQPEALAGSMRAFLKEVDGQSIDRTPL